MNNVLMMAIAYGIDYLSKDKLGFILCQFSLGFALDERVE